MFRLFRNFVAYFSLISPEPFNSKLVSFFPFFFFSLFLCLLLLVARINTSLVSRSRLASLRDSRAFVNRTGEITHARTQIIFMDWPSGVTSRRFVGDGGGSFVSPRVHSDSPTLLERRCHARFTRT